MVVLDILSTECTANFIYSYPDVTYPMSPGASVMAGYPAMYAPPNMAYGGVKSAAPAYAPVYSMPGAGQAMQGGVGQQPQVAYAPASYPQQYTQQPVPQYATQQTQPTAGGTSAKLSGGIVFICRAVC